MRPALIDSAIVGKSVNLCDSNRVDWLFFEANAVTGHVRWQVTGRNATRNTSRRSFVAEPSRSVPASMPGLKSKQTKNSKEDDETQ